MFRGQQGSRQHQGALGTPRGVGGIGGIEPSGDVECVRGALGD